MTAGMLDGLGLEDVPDRLPATEYAGSVFDLKVVNAKDAAKGRFIVMTFKVNEGEYKGETADLWQSANAHDSMTQKKWLKAMFTNIGVPENKIGSVTKEDVVGTPVFFTIKHNGAYTNIVNVKLRSGAAAVADEPSVAAQPVESGNIADLL